MRAKESNKSVTSNAIRPVYIRKNDVAWRYVRFGKCQCYEWHLIFVMLCIFFSVLKTMFKYGNIALVGGGGQGYMVKRSMEKRGQIIGKYKHWRTHAHKQRRIGTIANQNFINEHFVTWWLRWIRHIEPSHHPMLLLLALLLFFFFSCRCRSGHRDTELCGNFKLIEAKRLWLMEDERMQEGQWMVG